jgi:hypothetical protein
MCESGPQTEMRDGPYGRRNWCLKHETWWKLCDCHGEASMTVYLNEEDMDVNDDPLKQLFMTAEEVAAHSARDVPVRRPRGRPRGQWRREQERPTELEALGKALYVHFSKGELLWDDLLPGKREDWRQQAEDLLKTVAEIVAKSPR